MKKNVFLKRLLLAAVLFAPTGANAQVTIGSGDLPQATLDIIGDTATVHSEAFRLIDGNQAPGKVLTCQENGVGTWQPPAIFQILGVKSGQNLDFPLVSMTGDNRTWMKQTGGYITLPPGKWEVSVTILLALVDMSSNPINQYNLTANDFAWVRTTFSDSSTAEGPFTTIMSPDIVGSNLISGRICGPLPAGFARTYNMMTGAVIINNTSGADKNYYYVAGYIESASNFTEDQVVVRLSVGGENEITASPIL